MSFGKYQFLPWSRRGISGYINEADTLGKANGVAIERATVPVTVNVNADVQERKDFLMLGPGDISGIQSDMIIRTEPLNGITNFEPNYLAYIEFYDEDFPWRYTPAHAVGDSDLLLRPWLALVVLSEGEFEDTKRRKPLPSIKVLNTNALPPHDEMHLWAHTHINLARERQTEFEDFLDDLQKDAPTDPDGLFSRLICPRRLEANTPYHAFLLPAYETGRLSGLGLTINEIPAQQPAWGAGSDNELPVYFRWFFRTGANFDFEYLIKLLEPRVMDKRVGMRPMDCSAPGFNQADQPGPVSGLNLPTPLLLEGALKAPSAKSSVFPDPANPQDFLPQLEKLVNLNQKQFEHPDEDPYVTVPFYGMYHAMRKDPVEPEKKVLPTFKFDSDIWYNDLNRDPRTRVPAGFGVRMVQENQEKFMDLAWKQLKEVLEANRKMQAAQLVAKVSTRVYDKHIKTLSEEKLLSVARPLSARVLAGSVTVKHAVEESQVPGAVFSHPFRRVTRNQTALLRGLRPKFTDNMLRERSVADPEFSDFPDFQPGFRLKNLLDGLNAEGDARLTAAPAARFEAVAGLDISKPLDGPESLKDIQVWSLQSNLDTDFIYNQTNFTGGLPVIDKWNFFFGPGIFEPGGLETPVGGNVLGGGIFDPGFDLGPLGPDVVVLRAPAPPPPSDFKTTFVQQNDRVGFAETVVFRGPLAVPQASNSTLETVRPGAAYLRYLSKTIQYKGVAPLHKPGEEEDFLPAMAYPDFPDPSYEYLVKIDQELLIPNLHLIPPDTISLLRTNQKFIESYLVGLNYEMGREMLWREYPTDMRGSYFRQFWDMSGFVTPATTATDAEAKKDIKPIHTWSVKDTDPDRLLGKHNAQDPEGDTEQLVFVIRGELLKKYPNTVIYAQKAFMEGGIRKIHENTTVEKEIIFPIYKADIAPDIKLLGFNLTIEQAAGTEETDDFPGDHNGWFFIIAEVPGEPRFGMDLTYNPNKPDEFTWNDLSWENFGGQTLEFIRGDLTPGNTASGKVFTPPSGTVADATGAWNRSSADMAAILFQRPVMIATHATEMLDEEVINDAKKT